MSVDSAAIDELLRVSKPGALHTVTHYLYFPARETATRAANQLRRQGFIVEECRDPFDNTNWLVLARHALIPSEATIGSVRQLMEDLVSAAAGEYDGWEAEVRS